MVDATRHSDTQETAEPPGNRARFTRGFVAMLPLWAGAIPVGVAYSIAARSVGMEPYEIQLMSLMVFSAAAQVSAVSLLGEGANSLLVIGTVLALNAQLLLLGLTAGRWGQPSRIWRLVSAFFLTDGAYGVALAGAKFSLPRLAGTGMSMFVGWNLGTIFGLVAGEAVPDIRSYGVDFVVPLTFLAVLVPLLWSRARVMTAAVAVFATLVMAELLSGGVVVLIAGITGSAAGTLLHRRGRDYFGDWMPR